MKLKGILGIAVICFCLFFASCTHLAYVQNYEAGDGPRYADFNVAPLNTKSPGTIKVVTYNIQLSRKVEEAVRILTENEEVKDADIICLQEMTAESVVQVARILGYNYVYYPSAVHPANNSDFGNAVLSKWPVLADRKINLPHSDADRLYKLHRVAVEATILIGETPVLVYSTHLGAILTPQKRLEQAVAVLAAVPGESPHCLIAGDFNTYTQNHLQPIVDVFERSGFLLATDDLAWTYKHWYWLNKKSKLDLIFTKGLESVGADRIYNRTASDHVPVWVEIRLH